MKPTNISIVLLIAGFTLIYYPAWSQTGNEFWFGAPDITNLYGSAPQNGAPLNLHITSVHPTTVTIDRPGDLTFEPIVLNLSAAMQHVAVQLNSQAGGHLTIGMIETYSNPKSPSGDTAASRQYKAFRITSYPGEITAYYEFNNTYNRGLMQLKGANALGTEFYVSTQNAWWNDTVNYANASNGFVIAATQNNTRVVVYQNDDWLFFSPAKDSIVLILNRGESFAFHAERGEASRHINGVKVKSDKNIAITVFDDAIFKEANPTSGIDLIADQIVPVANTGMTYLVSEGAVDSTTTDGGEKIFITATEDNTPVYIDDMLETTIAGAGDIFSYPITGNTLVQSTKPILVNHVTGFGGELDLAILPPVDNCMGSFSVTSVRSHDATDAFRLFLIMKNDTLTGSPTRNMVAKNFVITTSSGSTSVPESYFDYFMDSAWVLLQQNSTIFSYLNNLIPTGEEFKITNSVSPFHAGALQGGFATGAKYGYFSEYNATEINAGIGCSNCEQEINICGTKTFQLVATGGISYTWTCTSDPNMTQYINDVHRADPTFIAPASGEYTFEVEVISPCSVTIPISLTAHVMDMSEAAFTFSDTTKCEANTILFKNTTETALADKMIWDFGYDDAKADQDTMASSFYWSFPVNETSADIEYTVKLSVWGAGNVCPDSVMQEIVVVPAATADYSLSDELGCSPLSVDFTNLSEGDDLSFSWLFGEEGNSQETNPGFTFNYSGTGNSVIDVVLEALRDDKCVDSVVKQVTVHPEITVSLDMNNFIRCSPIDTIIDPSLTTGADSIIWHFTYPVSIDEEIHTGVAPYHYSYINNSANSNNVILHVTGKNQYDCQTNNVLVSMLIRPGVEAGFTANPSSGRSPLQVSFTNTSVNATSYEWDFGDNQYATETNPAHMYASIYPESFPVSLLAANDYCYDIFETNIDITSVSDLAANTSSGELLVFFDNQSDEIVIRISQSQTDALLLELVDLTGRLILSKDLKISDRNNYETRINLEKKVQGACIVRLYGQGYYFAKVIRVE